MMGESFGLASADGRDPGVQEHQRVQLRATNWLGGLVARVPVRIRTKLLVSLAVMVVVLVTIGGLGLRAVGESNARFGALATLQRKGGQLPSTPAPEQPASLDGSGADEPHGLPEPI